MASKLRDRNDWFDVWFEDKNWIIDIMLHNMLDDLNVGYDYFGSSITRQKAELDAYKAQMDIEMDMFKGMTEEEVNRWCFYDLKKRGAIE